MLRSVSGLYEICIFIFSIFYGDKEDGNDGVGDKNVMKY